MILQHSNQARGHRNSITSKSALCRVALALVTASVWVGTGAHASEALPPKPIPPHEAKHEQNSKPRPGYDSQGNESMASVPIGMRANLNNEQKKRQSIAPRPGYDSNGEDAGPMEPKLSGPPRVHDTSIEIKDDGAAYSITGNKRTLIGKAGLIHKGRSPREAYWVFDSVTQRAPASYDDLAFGFKQTRVTDKPVQSRARKASFRIER